MEWSELWSGSVLVLERVSRVGSGSVVQFLELSWFGLVIRCDGTEAVEIYCNK